MSLDILGSSSMDIVGEGSLGTIMEGEHTSRGICIYTLMICIL